MSELNLFSEDMMRQFQDLGEEAGGSRANPKENLVGGSDLQSWLKVYQIDGIPGIDDWISERTQDLVSAEGMPLPFAEAIQQASGMSAAKSIEWLTVNLADLAETCSEAVIMAFFRKNSQAFSICLILGIAFGLYNDNPLLIATNGLQYFNKLRREGRLQYGIWSSADRFIRTSVSFLGQTCITTFVADTALGFVGVRLSDLTGHCLDTLATGKQLSSAAKLVSEVATTADWVDGFASFGLSVVVGKAVGKVVDLLNEDLKKELVEVGPRIETRERLLELIKREAPIESLMPVIELMQEQGSYKSGLKQ